MNTTSDSVRIVRAADQLHSDVSRVERMQGLEQADRAALVRAKLILDDIRDRHRIKLGFAERPRTRCIAAEIRG